MAVNVPKLSKGVLQGLSTPLQKWLLLLVSGVNQGATVSDLTNTAGNIQETIKTVPPKLNNNSNFLASDVALTSANTFYQGPSLTLAAGTWLLLGSAFFTGLGSNYATAQLWDGNGNVLSSGEVLGAKNSLFLTGVVVLTASGTFMISAACSGTGATMAAAATDNGVGQNASYLVALQIG